MLHNYHQRCRNNQQCPIHQHRGVSGGTHFKVSQHLPGLCVHRTCAGSPNQALLTKLHKTIMTVITNVHAL